jgi:hypothetical protein
MFFGRDNREKSTALPVAHKRISAQTGSVELFSVFGWKPAFFSYLHGFLRLDLFNGFKDLFEIHGVGMKNAINSCKVS